MIVGDRIGIINVLGYIARPMIAMLILDVAVTVAYVGFGLTWIAPATMPLPLIGTGLAVIVGFRNNIAYARWWEARQLWGLVVNYSRSLVRANATLMPEAEAEELRMSIGVRQIAWTHALKSHLRGEDPWPDLERLLPEGDLQFLHTVENVPFALQMEIASEINQAQAAGYLDTIEVSSLNNIMNELANCQGGLERIKNTPMPRQYANLPRIFVAVYCLMLPFGVVPDLRWFTPLVSSVIGFLFLSLEAAGSLLENPFERTVNEMPMSTITRNIEIDLRQSLGLKGQMPRRLRPVHGVLR